jgi:hypothetical protein
MDSTMGLAEFVSHLSILHEKARKNELSPSERDEYERDREDLAATILNAQKINLKPGETARRAIRANRVLPVELTVGSKATKSVTLEVSSTGFSVMLPPLSPEWQDTIRFKMKLPGGSELKGSAKAMSATPSAGHVRVGFQMTDIAEADREELTRLVFDDLLDKLRRGPAAPKKS